MTQQQIDAEFAAMIAGPTLSDLAAKHGPRARTRTREPLHVLAARVRAGGSDPHFRRT
jgi:hypothetical protein